MKRVLLVVALALCPGTAQATTFHVRAGAPAGGDGSVAKPFASLAAVAAASAAGDTIVVDPATSALGGGIALKPGQRLLGGGAPVAGATRAPLPLLTNPDA